MDLLGLRWTRRGFGSPGRHSIRPNCRLPVGATPNDVFGSRRLVVVTSLLFGAYHWWTGMGNIVEAVLIGVLLMLFYIRSAALWPVVLAHYLTDMVDFGL